MIDTDTRQLKRDPTGLYRSGAGKIPCDHCGHKLTCPLRPLTKCSLFLPALPFTVETGLGKISNTMRVGVAWTDRLRHGQTIALYHSIQKRIFGYAGVIGMEHGPIAAMLKRHAHANHLMLDTPTELAADTLFLWQRQQYGPQIINNKTRLTAIYLLRLPQPPAAPDFEGHEARRSVESGSPRPGKDHGDGGGDEAADRRAEGP